MISIPVVALWVDGEERDLVAEPRKLAEQIHGVDRTGVPIRLGPSAVDHEGAPPVVAVDPRGCLCGAVRGDRRVRRSGRTVLDGCRGGGRLLSAGRPPADGVADSPDLMCEPAEGSSHAAAGRYRKHADEPPQGIGGAPDQAVLDQPEPLQLGALHDELVLQFGRPRLHRCDSRLGLGKRLLRDFDPRSGFGRVVLRSGRELGRLTLGCLGSLLKARCCKVRALDFGVRHSCCGQRLGDPRLGVVGARRP